IFPMKVHQILIDSAIVFVNFSSFNAFTLAPDTIFFVIHFTDQKDPSSIFNLKTIKVFAGSICTIVFLPASIKGV
ncbi:MAG: hypothetical protein KAR03_12645, partial [Candidatus Thorarchaeota archaeon]|nr:hypothetical protein [Candidatus Thorarchaeota archaeon]